MSSWLTSNNRKVHQRAINQAVRQLNKNIQNDPLWRGRFKVSQEAAQWYSYEDGSGYELYVVLRFTDTKTGKIQELGESVNHWLFTNGFHLWKAMNDFIVDFCNVWSENPRPSIHF